MSEPSPSAASPAEPSYPGERLGLPENGPGAVAGWGRRFLALAVDWAASMLVAALFYGTAVWTGPGLAEWAPMLVFLVEASLLTPLVGGSFGQLATRMVVVRLDGRPLGLLQAVLRTVLICLVIPPLVFNRDQRGLHDLATGSITLRR
ncbi:MAG TPA: RDD family protein [Nocardioidaceae bacterium]